MYNYFDTTFLFSKTEYTYKCMLNENSCIFKAILDQLLKIFIQKSIIVLYDNVT